MPQDNDIIILQMGEPDTIIDERPKPRRKSKPKLKTGLISGVRMDIEELNELKDADLRKDTRTDIFLGEDIDKFQKQEIYKHRKVYVRGHTKKGKDGKILVIKPYMRNK